LREHIGRRFQRGKERKREGKREGERGKERGRGKEREREGEIEREREREDKLVKKSRACQLKKRINNQEKIPQNHEKKIRQRI